MIRATTTRAATICATMILAVAVALGPPSSATASDGAAPEPFADAEALAAHVAALTGGELLAPGSWGSVSREGDRFTFEDVRAGADPAIFSATVERVTFEAPARLGPLGLAATRIAMEGAEADYPYQGGTFGFASVTVEDVRLAAVDGEFADIFPDQVRAFTAEDVSIALPNFPEGVESVAIEASERSAGFPQRVTARVAGLALNPASARGSIVARLIVSLPPESAVFDLDFDVTWDAARAVMRLGDYRLAIRNVIAVAADVSLGGASEALVERIMTRGENEYGALALESSRITVQRGPKFDAALDSLAETFGVRPRALRGQASDVIGYAAGYVGGGDERASALWEAAKALIAGEVETVTLRMEPSGSATLEAISDSAVGRLSTGDTTFDLLGLTIETE